MSNDPACWSMLPRTCPFLGAATGSPCKARACHGGARDSKACRAAIVHYCAVQSADPACASMLPRSCPFIASAPGSPCKDRSCGALGKESTECRGSVAKYCTSKAGAADPACWSLLPKSCPFSKTIAGSPCKAVTGGAVVSSEVQANNLARAEAERVAAVAVGAATAAKTKADAAVTDAAAADVANTDAAAALAKVTGSAAACTGDNDGTTKACELNGDSSACMVVGGNCMYVAAVADGADAGALKVVAEKAAADALALGEAAKAATTNLAAADAASARRAANVAALPAAVPISTQRRSASSAAIACGMIDLGKTAYKRTRASSAACRASVAHYCASAAAKQDNACASLRLKSCPFSTTTVGSPCYLLSSHPALKDAAMKAKAAVVVATTAAAKAVTDAATAEGANAVSQKAKTDAAAALAKATADGEDTVVLKAAAEKAEVDALALGTTAKDAADAATAAATALTGLTAASKTADAADIGVATMGAFNPCMRGAASYPECRAHVVQYCSKNQKTDAGCAQLSTKTCAFHAVDDASAKAMKSISPCRAVECSVKTNTPACRAVVALYCTDTKPVWHAAGVVVDGASIPTVAPKDDDACLRIGGRCPFTANKMSLLNPCRVCGATGSKSKPACRAAVIKYCSSDDGRADLACHGNMYRSKDVARSATLGSTELFNLRGAPVLTLVTASQTMRTGISTALDHDSFDLEVISQGPLLGGKFAIFENNKRPANTAADFAGAHYAGDLTSFSDDYKTTGALTSKTNVVSCKFLPTKTYWVVVQVSNAVGTTQSKAVRVRSPNDLETLKPELWTKNMKEEATGVQNTPVNVPAGWPGATWPNQGTTHKGWIDSRSLVGPVFSVNYKLREAASANKIDLHYQRRDGQSYATTSYKDYPYGAVGRTRRLRIGTGGQAKFGRALAVDVQTAAVARGLVESGKYFEDEQWGASLYERSGHNAPQATGLGACGQHTYTHKSKSFASGEKYTVTVNYNDMHMHGTSSVESSDFKVDTELPKLGTPTLVNPTLRVHGDTVLSEILYEPTEQGWLYYAVHDATRENNVITSMAVTPTNVELATNPETVNTDSPLVTKGVVTMKRLQINKLDLFTPQRASGLTVSLGFLPNADYVVHAVPVDIAGNIGALLTINVPAVPKPGVPETPPAELKPAMPSAIQVKIATKVGAVFMFRISKSAKGRAQQVGSIWWFAVEANLAGGPTTLPVQEGSTGLTKYRDLDWNKESVSPKSDRFNLEIGGLKSSTEYVVWFSTANPKTTTFQPQTVIVPEKGVKFITLDANAIEYAAALRFPLVGPEGAKGVKRGPVVGLRVSVTLGSTSGSELTAIFRKGAAGAWDGDTKGMNQDLVSGVKADKATNTYVRTYKVPASGAGDFTVMFDVPEIPTAQCIQDFMILKGTNVKMTGTDADFKLPEFKAAKDNCEWTLFYMPFNAKLLVLEVTAANKGKVFKISAQMTLRGYSVCTLGPVQRSGFCKAILKKSGIVGSTCQVTGVKDPKGLQRVEDCVKRRLLPTPTGGRRALSLTRALAEDAGVEIDYELTLSDARDLARANIIREELASFAEISKDPVLGAQLVAALADEGLLGDDPVNNPISIIGASKPKTNYDAGAFTKPSFGFGAKPLVPVSPEDPAVNQPKPPKVGLAGAEIGAIVGGILAFLAVLGAAFWFVHFRHAHMRADATGHHDHGKGGKTVGSKTTVKTDDAEETGIEMRGERAYSNTGVRDVLAKKAAVAEVDAGEDDVLAELEGETKGEAAFDGDTEVKADEVKADVAAETQVAVANVADEAEFSGEEAEAVDVEIAGNEVAIDTQGEAEEVFL